MVHSLHNNGTSAEKQNLVALVLEGGGGVSWGTQFYVCMVKWYVVAYP